MWILRTAKQAFSNWTMVLGMFVGAVSVFNVLQRGLSIDLTAIFAAVIDAYHAVFHRLFDWFTGWLPFQFAPWVKDATVMWFVLWAALARIMWIIYHTDLKERGKGKIWLAGQIPVVGALMDLGYVGVGAAFLVSVFIWPVIMGWLALARPHFYKYEHTGVSSRITREEENYFFDIRLLYLVQIMMMVGGAVFAVVSNVVMN